MSKNERVNTFSLLLFFFCHGEVLVEFKKKPALQPSNPGPLGVPIDFTGQQ